LTPAAQSGIKPSVEAFTANHFLPYLGTIFRFQPPGNGAPIELELLEVMSPPKPARGSAYRREPFSLLFRAGPGQEMAPVLHTLVHDAFEPGLIFVSRIIPPVDRDPKEAYYEAIFN
jgi:hypothetical protein